MSVAGELFKLQEIDLEIASKEQDYASISSQIGESEEVTTTREKLDSERQQLEETTHQQHTVEWEIEDISAKLANFEDELYSGRTTNPKELTSLQQEIEILRTKRGKLEDRDLEIMETVDQLNKSTSALESRLKTLESEWQNRQKELAAELKELEELISKLKKKREEMAAGFDSQIIGVYNELKKQRGTSVAKVEQGICRGCRISLPVNELQQVRSGKMVRCSSCGRILFLA